MRVPEGVRVLRDIEYVPGGGMGYGLAANDTTPGYTDAPPLPATPSKWKYKAIYHVGDQRVGLWSNKVTITVGG